MSPMLSSVSLHCSQCPRKRVRQLKKGKSHVFLDFEKKTLKTLKKRTGKPTQPIVSQATSSLKFYHNVSSAKAQASEPLVRMNQTPEAEN